MKLKKCTPMEWNRRRRRRLSRPQGMLQAAMLLRALPSSSTQSSISAASGPEATSECESVATTVNADNEEPPPWRANYGRASATYQYANYPRGAWTVNPSHGYRGQDPWRNWQAPSGRSQSTGSSNKGKGRKRPHSHSTGPKHHDNNCQRHGQCPELWHAGHGEHFDVFVGQHRELHFRKPRELRFLSRH